MTSVALIVLDTLRQDAFAENFNWLPGARFEQCYSTSHWTVPAHASLFTGRYASEVGTYAKSSHLQDGYPTLGELTVDRKSRFYSANPQMAYHEGWTTNFDEVMSPWEVKHPDSCHLVDWDDFAVNCDKEGLPRYLEAVKAAARHDGPTLRSLWKGYKASIHDHTDVDDSGAVAILDRIRNADVEDDEFIFLNLMEAHGPYDPPAEYRSVEADVNPVFADKWSNDAPDPDVARRAYEDAVDYLSDIYREIFAELESAYDVVVTVSDHGELLGEHGHWNHVHGVYPELTHVPLVISGVDVPAENTEKVVNLLDVHQTVAELLGVSDESQGRGESLLEPVSDKPRYTEFHGLPTWINGQLQRTGVSDVYDRYNEPLFGVCLPDGSYGYQSVDGDRGDVPEKQLDRQIRSHTNTVPTDFSRSSMEVDDSIREQLEDLGYA